MKTLCLMVLLVSLLGCARGKPGKDQSSAPLAEEMGASASHGIGEVTSVSLKTPLEQDRVDRGLALFEANCSKCHKLSDGKLVGPGWKDVTRRRKPEWIMNMITNVNVMLDKDTEAQKLFELCLVRMPKQTVTMEEARDILEFMRHNDGEK